MWPSLLFFYFYLEALTSKQYENILIGRVCPQKGCWLNVDKFSVGRCISSWSWFLLHLLQPTVLYFRTYICSLFLISLSHVCSFELLVTVIRARDLEQRTFELKDCEPAFGSKSCSHQEGQAKKKVFHQKAFCVWPRPQWCSFHQLQLKCDVNAAIKRSVFVFYN